MIVFYSIFFCSFIYESNVFCCFSQFELNGLQWKKCHNWVHLLIVSILLLLSDGSATYARFLSCFRMNENENKSKTDFNDSIWWYNISFLFFSIFLFFWENRWKRHRKTMRIEWSSEFNCFSIYYVFKAHLLLENILFSIEITHFL